MGKIEELARVEFTNAFIHIVDRCKLVKKEGKKGELKKGEYESGAFVDCGEDWNDLTGRNESLDINEMFERMLNANKTFELAKKMGL